jgi:N-acetylglucosaminyldiphosphoundecaprenol N-acetyl-beta-D-mannosaminyltransferase
MGTRIHRVTETQVIEHILCELDAGRGGWVVTPNLDHVRRLRTDKSLVELYNTAGLSVADGMPLIWASKLQGTPLPQRVPGSGLINTLSKAAGEKGKTVYLLGGDPGSADNAAQILTQRYPGLKIVGTCCPNYGFEKDPEVLKALIDQIVIADPDIVFVALGSPKQELLIGRIRNCLPKAWWLGVGISFSFVCGQVRRAPSWMQKMGLEWIHRLVQEPKRLAGRYLLQGVPFAFVLLSGSLMKRFIRSPKR